MKALLPPANEVWGKVKFLHQFVILFTGGGGRAWLLGGACMVALGGGRAWDTTRHGDTVNERAVRILLECILVFRYDEQYFCFSLDLAVIKNKQHTAS